MSESLSKTVTVINEAGLHARPADQLVRLSSKFQSDIVLEKNGERIDCKSILSILTLGAVPGTELLLKIDGNDASQAMDSITEFFASGFEEPADPNAQT